MFWSADSNCWNMAWLGRIKDWFFVANFDERAISGRHFDELPLEVELESELVTSGSSDVDDFNRVAVEHALDLVSAAWKFNLEK